MARQLVLLDSPNTDWHLDDATRTAGKRGIAAARAALAAVADGGAPGYRADDNDSHLPAA